MIDRRVSRPFALFMCLAVPASAWADAVVLTPLLPSRGVKQERVEDLFSLMSSELEFMEGISEVIELDPAPPSLTTGCLESTRCLGTITREAQGDVILTGTVEDVGGEIAVDLIYFDARTNRIVRRKTHTLPSAASELVDAVTPVLVEALTGVSPTEERRQEEEMESFDFGSDLASDDVAFYEDQPIERAPAPTTPPAGRARAVDRPITAPPPPEPPPEDAFDPDAFSFGDAAEDISFGTSPDDITTAPEPEPEPRYEPPPPTRYEREDAYAPAFVDMDDDLDLDRGRSPGDTRSKTTRRGGDDDPVKAWRRAHIRLGGGFARYGVFNFGTAGGELQVRAFDGLTFVVGANAFLVSRELPPEEQQATGRRIRTDFILPINIGIVYRIKPGRFQPYVGADGVFAQYYADPETGQRRFTGGARARLGFDYYFTRNFGINADVALGFLTGNNWPDVDPRNPTIGFLPHLGGGIVIAF